jgi:NADPH-dependent curcumin reductase CurA
VAHSHHDPPRAKSSVVRGSAPGAGAEHFPDALLMLFRGENFGKLVLQVANE